MVLGHGVDIVEIARIAAMLATHGEAFVARCFTDAERAYGDAAPRKRAERYAGRFACKEAVLKALGTGWSAGAAWREIEVGRLASGQPTLALRGRCAELASRLGISRWTLSITHTDTLAMASVVGIGEPTPS
jgi:holo-[acyl-carrier protein] synthase